MTLDDWLAANGLSTIDWRQDPYLRGAIELLMPMLDAPTALGQRGGQPMRLEVVVLDLPGFGAWALSPEDCDVVAFTRGAIPLLHDIMRAVVSHPHVLPGFRSDGGGLEEISAPGTLADVVRGMPWAVPELQDEKREFLASGLTLLALSYILLHELTHIMHGHTDYFAKKFHLPAIAEIEVFGTPAPSGFWRETLEFDADCGAILNMLSFALTVRSVDERGHWVMPPLGRFGKPEEALQLALIACSTCAFLFDALDRSDPLDEAPRTHPHPLIRFRLILQQFEHVLRIRRPEDADFLTLQASAGFVRLVPTWVEIFSKDAINPAATVPAIDQIFARRLAIWQQTWAELRPELDKLKRAGMLAPAVST